MFGLKFGKEKVPQSDPDKKKGPKDVSKRIALSGAMDVVGGAIGAVSNVGDSLGTNLQRSITLLSRDAEEYEKPTWWEYVNYNFENRIQSNPSTLLLTLVIVVLIAMIFLGGIWYVSATYTSGDTYGDSSWSDSLYLTSQVVLIGGFEEFSNGIVRLVSILFTYCHHSTSLFLINIHYEGEFCPNNF